MSLCRKGRVEANFVSGWIKTVGGQALELKHINCKLRLFRKGFGKRIDKVVKRLGKLLTEVQKIKEQQK